MSVSLVLESALALGVLDALSEQIAVLDGAGVIVAVNQSWRNFAVSNGAREVAEHFIGVNYLSICAEAPAHAFGEEAAAVAMGIRAVLAGEQAEFTLEYPCDSPDEVRWFEVRVTRLEGSPAHVVMRHQDISVRKRLLDELRKSEEKWRTLVAMLPVGVGILDGDGELVAPNPALGKILGTMREALPDAIRREWSIMRTRDVPMPSESRPSPRGTPAVISGAPAEISFLTAGNSVVCAEVSGAPLPHSNGSRVIAVVDTTARNRADHAIREREHFLRTAINAVPAMVAHWTPELRCDFANRAFFEWFGRPEQEILGATWKDVFGEARFLQTERRLHAALNGEPQHFERSVRVNDGCVRNLWTHFIPDLVDGRIQGFFVVNSDVTSLKAAERALLTSLREKEALLKEVHHRVKNNLQSITALLRLAAAQAHRRTLPEMIAEFEQRIQAMALVHETLHDSAEFALVDMQSYVTRIGLALSSGLGDRAREIEVRVRAEGLSVDAELAMRCGLIINELVSNALKHAFAGRARGIVDVAMSEVPCELYRLVVSDDGNGMPQLDFASEATLGLRLVRGLAEQLGGTARRMAGEASAIEVTFPRPQ